MKNSVTTIIKNIHKSGIKNRILSVSILLALIAAFFMTIAVNRPTGVTNANNPVASKQRTKQNLPQAPKPSQTDVTADTRTLASTQSAPAGQAKSVTTTPSSQPATKPKPVYTNDLPDVQYKQVQIVDFYITISPWSITHLTPNNFQVPYVIKHSEYHLSPIISQSGRILSDVPGMSCNPYSTQKDFGEIGVYVPDGTPAGQYTCQITLSDGSISKSAQFTYTVTGSALTTP